MKAILCTALGPPEELRIHEVDMPRPRPGQVLVRVEAAALNYPDALTVQGLYQIQPNLPWCPGAEIAGTIIELGAGVVGFAPGDRVAAVVGAEGHAEYCIADAQRTIALPSGVDIDSGAAMLVYGRQSPSAWRSPTYRAHCDACWIAN